MGALSHSYSSLKQFENCPLRYYRQRILKEVTDPGGEASRHGERIHALLEARLKGEGLPEEAAKFEPLCRAVERLAADGELHVEKELVLNAQLQPTGWWSEDAWLRSKLDFLAIAETSSVVGDWKSGKRRPDMFQMEISAAQIFQHFPQVQTVTALLVWLGPMAVDSETYTRRQLPELWTEILGRVRRIESAAAENVWQARPSGLCNYCPCKPTCEFAK